MRVTLTTQRSPFTGETVLDEENQYPPVVVKGVDGLIRPRSFHLADYSGGDPIVVQLGEATSVYAETTIDGFPYRVEFFDANAVSLTVARISGSFGAALLPVPERAAEMQIIPTDTASQSLTVIAF